MSVVDVDAPAERLILRELRLLLESRLRYHLRCLREDATDPEMTSLERLALIRDRARRMREIRGTLRVRLVSGRKLP
jgi:hypothetical protein